jgi:hypothetical protein
MAARTNLWSVATVASLGFILLAASATVATGQTAERHISVFLGYGRADPIPIALAFTAPAWTVAVQAPTGRHLIFETTATGWSHHSALVVSSESGDSHPPFQFRRTLTQRDTRLSFSFDVLATGTIRRLRLNSGVGIGGGQLRRVQAQRVETCVSADPRLCGIDFERVSNTTLLAMQLVVGANMAIASRVGASVVYRLSQPLSAELGDAGVLAGVTLTLR